MDNFRVDITAEGDSTLAAAMKLAFGKYRSATHYAVRPAFAGEREEVPADAPKWTKGAWKYGKEPKPLRLVFYWSASESAPDLVALPFKMDAEGAADFARRWLAEADYGNQPDHDGDNEKGWRLYNEAWGHVDSHWGAFVAVAPEWAMHGK